MPLNPTDPHELRLVIVDTATNSPNRGEFFALDPNNASGVPLPSFRTGPVLPPVGTLAGEGFFVTTSRRGYVWTGTAWDDVTPNPIKSYPSDADLLAAVDAVGTYANTRDTGNLYVRLAAGWKQVNVRQFPNYAALVADTDAPLGTQAEVVDEGTIFERRSVGGGQRLTPGVSGDWRRYQTTGFPEPNTPAGRTGLWLDITAQTNFTASTGLVPGGFPLTLAAPAVITVPLNDGTNRTITLPAKVYPDLDRTDSGTRAGANSLAHQLFYEYLNAGVVTNTATPIIGYTFFKDGGSLLLRVEVASTSTSWPVGCPTTAIAGQNWVATTLRELPNLAAILNWAGDAASNIGDEALAKDTGIQYVRVTNGWRPTTVVEDTEVNIRGMLAVQTGQEAYATDTGNRFVFVGGQWVEDPIQHFPTETALLAATPPSGTLSWADDTGNVFARVGTNWKGLNTGFSDPIPIGTLSAFPSDAIPGGWLKCDGSAIPASTDYDALRALLGTTTVPDLRGEFLRGKADAQNPLQHVDWSTARPKTAFTTDRGGQHWHNINLFTWDDGLQHTGDTNVAGGIGDWAGWSGDQSHKKNSSGPIHSDGAHSHTVTGGGDTETAPDHTLVNWCIKAKYATVLPPVFANNITAPVDGQVLTFNATTGLWENKAPGGGFVPVMVTPPADGDIVVYDAANGVWENRQPLKAVNMTQATYDALATKDPNTIYMITGP